MIKKIFSRPQAVIGLILIAIMVICAVFAPAIAPNPPDLIDTSIKYHEADADYPLGTDQLGRSRGTGRVLCNELNTLPGFTSISMYPKLMEHEGYSYPALVDKLLTLAVHRRKGAY